VRLKVDQRAGQLSLLDTSTANISPAYAIVNFQRTWHRCSHIHR